MKNIFIYDHFYRKRGRGLNNDKRVFRIYDWDGRNAVRYLFSDWEFNGGY